MKSATVQKVKQPKILRLWELLLWVVFAWFIFSLITTPNLTIAAFDHLIQPITYVILLRSFGYFGYKSYKALTKSWSNFKKNRRLERWKEQLEQFDSVLVYTIRTEKDIKPRYEIDKYLLWLNFDPKEIDRVWSVFNAQPR